MIDWTKPLQTQDGRKVEFLRKLKGNCMYPYIVCGINPDGTEWINDYNEQGKCITSYLCKDADIINILM